jgi:Nuclease-related domain
MAGTESTRATVYNKAGAGVRKMESTRWLAALFILIIMYAGIYYYTKSVKTIATLGLPVALVVFVGIIYWIKAMGDKANAIADRALDARRGAVAEEAIGNLPGELPAGYFVVNDFVLNRGNIDHIVISTKGILTVETKSHRGVVSCEGETLKRDGKPFEKDFIRQAWAEAYSIRDLLTEKGVCNLRPQPVIVFTDADVQVKGKVRGVHIVSSKDFHAFLKGLPAWMSERLSTRIIDCLLSNQYSYRDRIPKPIVVTDTIASVPTPEVVVSPTLKH